jgi:hypothetical protein
MAPLLGRSGADISITDCGTELEMVLEVMVGIMSGVSLFPHSTVMQRRHVGLL